ncbi:hypothetical protein [Flavobacterium pedocola]
MKYLITISLFLFNSSINAQEFKRLTSESAEDFIKRNTPKSETTVLELSGKVLETKHWDNKTETIICFYVGADYNNNTINHYYLLGCLYVQIKPNVYRRILIDDKDLVFENEPIKVESVFFTNVDKSDSTKELAILYSHKADTNSEVIGTYYFTHFYDNINFTNPPKSLTEITTFKEIFHELEGRVDDSDFKKAKFKTASDVKKALRGLGY